MDWFGRRTLKKTAEKAKGSKSAPPKVASDKTMAERKRQAQESARRSKADGKKR